MLLRCDQMTSTLKIKVRLKIRLLPSTIQIIAGVTAAPARDAHDEIRVRVAIKAYASKKPSPAQILSTSMAPI